MKHKTIQLYQTHCCALCFMSANNLTTPEELGEVLNLLKEDAKRVFSPKVQDGGGQRAVECVTAPGEDNLQLVLYNAGFRVIARFPRRNGYPELGDLKLWFLSW